MNNEGNDNDNYQFDSACCHVSNAIALVVVHFFSRLLMTCLRFLPSAQ